MNRLELADQDVDELQELKLAMMGQKNELEVNIPTCNYYVHVFIQLYRIQICIHTFMHAYIVYTLYNALSTECKYAHCTIHIIQYRL